MINFFQLIEEIPSAPQLEVHLDSETDDDVETPKFTGGFREEDTFVRTCIAIN